MSERSVDIRRPGGCNIVLQAGRGLGVGLVGPRRMGAEVMESDPRGGQTRGSGQDKRCVPGGIRAWVGRIIYLFGDVAQLAMSPKQNRAMPWPFKATSFKYEQADSKGFKLSESRGCKDFCS